MGGDARSAEGRADRIELARLVLHLDVVAEHICDLMRVRELCQARCAGAIGVPILDRQQAGVESVAGEQPFVARIIDGDVRGLVAGDRENGQAAIPQLQRRLAVRPVG